MGAELCSRSVELGNSCRVVVNGGRIVGGGNESIPARRCFGVLIGNPETQRHEVGRIQHNDTN